MIQLSEDITTPCVFCGEPAESDHDRRRSYCSECAEYHQFYHMGVNNGRTYYQEQTIEADSTNLVKQMGWAVGKLQELEAELRRRGDLPVFLQDNSDNTTGENHG